jgi:DNA-binding CsgD family transcriptional regulator
MVTSFLSAPDLQALRAVNDALLDPLSHDTIDTWLLEVCARFETLCHAPASFAGFSVTHGEARFVSRDIPRSYLDRLAELSLLEPGSLRSSDPCVETLMENMRHRVSAVATSMDLLEPGPGGFRTEELKETPIFRDVACPLGVPGSALLFHSGATGEFMIHAAYPEIERRPFGEATHAVLSALLPGFAASMGALARLGNARQAIAVLLDVLADGAVVFDAGGREVLARNVAMGTLARDEPDASGLERTVIQAAAAAAWQTSASPPVPSTRDSQALSRGWRSSAGTSYRVRAVRLPSGSLTAGEAILVLIQRIGPQVPDASELRQRFGLTRREAEVAHRLAYGRSDREIATELGLSPHTVRHHAEAVFVKAGVTSRKALALHLGSSHDGGSLT